MSAIGGILFLDGRQVQKSCLYNMSESVNYRGPDRQGIWHEGHIGLFNNLLITIPESVNEKMPLKLGNSFITADSRIDNRSELYSKLELKKKIDAVTDSEIILSSYIKWGGKCVDHLLGDFSFAIWDGTNKKLFCARDHLGVKPFYYYYLPRKLFVFSSELKGLFHCGLIDKKINENRILDFLIGYEAIDKTSTSFENILKLPPAHIIEISTHNLSINSYWSFDPTVEINYSNQNEYNDHFLELYSESIKCRLKSTNKPASMLSGGVGLFNDCLPGQRYFT